MLAEQQFGLFEGVDWESEDLKQKYPAELSYYGKASAFGGRFWARVPLGESRFDVCTRVYQCFGAFYRDAQHNNVDNIIIVSHGCTLRAFTMMWLHKTPEWFEAEPNPENCSVQLITDSSISYIRGGPEGHNSSRKDLLLSQQEKHHQKLHEMKK